MVKVYNSLKKKVKSSEKFVFSEICVSDTKDGIKSTGYWDSTSVDHTLMDMLGNYEKF